MRVGLFDSGIGGLTVLKTLREKYPNNEYIYYGDTLNLPYGNKTKEELIELSVKNIDFLISKEVDIIVIACGTVSSNCITYLKNKYQIPIIDIVSPTINYLNNSDYNNVGVIATSATINSHVFKNNLNKEVYEIETPKLVPLIENNKLDNIEEILNEYLEEYLDKIDVLVLGCTHYPILTKYLDNILPNNIKILDMSSVLNIENKDMINNKVSIYYSHIDDTIVCNTKKILNSNSLSIKAVN